MHIGEGTFGRVKFGINQETGERVAIKIVEKQKIIDSDMNEQIRREITIMKMIHHPNVVDLREVMSSQTKIYMVLELCTGGELYDKVVERGRFSEDVARNYFCQLLSAIEYCHKHDIAHRDLKPENLLLDASGTLKVSDFGFSTMTGDSLSGEENMLHTACGTPHYVAPEVIRRTGYNGKQADIWSCGVLLYVMLTGKLPYQGNSYDILFAKIKKAAFHVPPNLSSEAVDFMRCCMNPDASARYTVEQLRQHQWLSGVVSDQSSSLALAVPSSSELKATAVNLAQSLSGTEAEAEDENEDTLFTPMPKGRETQHSINVFSLVSESWNVVGLSQPFLPRIQMSPKAKNSGSMGFEDVSTSDDISRTTRFFASVKSLEQGMETLVACVKELNGTITHRISNALRVDVVFSSKDDDEAEEERIVVGIVVLPAVERSLYYVEFNRLKGSGLVFHMFYREFKNVHTLSSLTPQFVLSPEIERVLSSKGLHDEDNQTPQ